MIFYISTGFRFSKISVGVWECSVHSCSCSCIKSIKSTFIALKMKLFDQQKIKLPAAVLAIFQKEPGWPCPVIMALKNPSLDFKNYFCFGFL